MIDGCGLFVIDRDVVAVQSGGEVEVIRGIDARSAKVLRSPRPMVTRLIAHFQRPMSRNSWLESCGPSDAQAACKLFETFVNHGYLASALPRDTRSDESAVPDCSDDVVQAIISLAYALRGDIRVLGGLTDASAPGLSSRLLACHQMLQRLSDQTGALRDAQVQAQLQTMSSAPPSRDGEVRLHLGCGEHRLPGWINIDITEGDLRLDLRKGLPFESHTVAAIFTGHLLEHLDYKEESLPVLQEMRRVLRPGGLARVVVPNIESFMRAYVAGDAEFFAEFERLWERPKSDTLLACLMHYAGAGGFPLVIDRHRFGYDADTLRALMAEAGFTQIRECTSGDSEIDEPGLDYSWAAAASASERTFGLIIEARG